MYGNTPWDDYMFARAEAEYLEPPEDDEEDEYDEDYQEYDRREDMEWDYDDDYDYGPDGR